MSEKKIYNKYSDYLKNKYGEKIYKLPINLPITCPNRGTNGGCTFCAEVGTGFEAMNHQISVNEQLEHTKSHIQRKYKANKFIAYFQNYTNTFMDLQLFRQYMESAAKKEYVVELSVSTRPDCIREDYLEVLSDISKQFQVDITIELGLQTANYHTLDYIERGHGLAEFIDAVLRIKNYSFTICTHVILNLPNDTLRDAVETAKILSALKIDIVKLHSLYIAKNTKMASQYLNHEFEICSKKEYFDRVKAFLEHIDSSMVVERLFSRIPEEDSLFSNWHTSWWRLQDELLDYLNQTDSFQGKKYNYLDGAALKSLK